MRWYISNKISVALANHVHAQPLDGVGKIQINAQAGLAHAAAFVAHRLGIARRHIARHQIAEAWIAPLQVIIALGFGDLIRRALVARLHRHPDAPVVAQRFAHQRQFRLVIARHRNAGRMNLREARIGKQRAAFVRAPDGRAVRSLGVGRKVINVSVAARSEHHGVAHVRFDSPGYQIARHDAARAAVDHHQIQHLGAREHGDASLMHLPLQRLIRAQQQLLPGLPARIKRARHLRAAEAAVGQRAAILARERHALRHALIDDVHADLRQPVNVGFARAEVAALHRVVKQPEDAVAVAVIILRGVDPALRRDASARAAANPESRSTSRCSPARPASPPPKRPPVPSPPR